MKICILFFTSLIATLQASPIAKRSLEDSNKEITTVKSAIRNTNTLTPENEKITHSKEHVVFDNASATDNSINGSTRNVFLGEKIDDILETKPGVKLIPFSILLGNDLFFSKENNTADNNGKVQERSQVNLTPAEADASENQIDKKDHKLIAKNVSSNETKENSTALQSFEDESLMKNHRTQTELEKEKPAEKNSEGKPTIISESKTTTSGHGEIYTKSDNLEQIPDVEIVTVFLKILSRCDFCFPIEGFQTENLSKTNRDKADVTKENDVSKNNNKSENLIDRKDSNKSDTENTGKNKDGNQELTGALTSQKPEGERLRDSGNESTKQFDEKDTKKSEQQQSIKYKNENKISVDEKDSEREENLKISDAKNPGKNNDKNGNLTGAISEKLESDHVENSGNESKKKLDEKHTEKSEVEQSSRNKNENEIPVHEKYLQKAENPKKSNTENSGKNNDDNQKSTEAIISQNLESEHIGNSSNERERQLEEKDSKKLEIEQSERNDNENKIPADLARSEKVALSEINNTTSVHKSESVKKDLATAEEIALSKTDTTNSVQSESVSQKQSHKELSEPGMINKQVNSSEENSKITPANSFSTKVVSTTNLQNATEKGAPLIERVL